MAIGAVAVLILTPLGRYIYAVGIGGDQYPGGPRQVYGHSTSSIVLLSSMLFVEVDARSRPADHLWRGDYRHAAGLRSARGALVLARVMRCRY